MVCRRFGKPRGPVGGRRSWWGVSDVAQQVPASEHPARDRHQLQTLILAVALLLTVVLAVLAAIVAARWLNDYGFLHFPLGFYLLAQGLIIYIIAVAFWFIRIQERIDAARAEREGSG